MDRYHTTVLQDKEAARYNATMRWREQMPALMRKYSVTTQYQRKVTDICEQQKTEVAVLLYDYSLDDRINTVHSTVDTEVGMGGG